jgi:hypothetical protein
VKDALRVSRHKYSVYCMADRFKSNAAEDASAKHAGPGRACNRTQKPHDSRVKRNSKLPMMAHTKGKNGLYRLWPGAPSNTTSAKSPVVSPEFVLSFPYPTAKVTVSLAFNSTCPE